MKIGATDEPGNGSPAKFVVRIEKGSTDSLILDLLLSINNPAAQAVDSPELP